MEKTAQEIAKELLEKIASPAGLASKTINWAKGHASSLGESIKGVAGAAGSGRKVHAMNIIKNPLVYGTGAAAGLFGSGIAVGGMGKQSSDKAAIAQKLIDEMDKEATIKLFMNISKKK